MSGGVIGLSFGGRRGRFDLVAGSGFGRVSRSDGSELFGIDPEKLGHLGWFHIRVDQVGDRFGLFGVGVPLDPLPRGRRVRALSGRGGEVTGCGGPLGETFLRRGRLGLGEAIVGRKIRRVAPPERLGPPPAMARGRRGQSSKYRRRLRGAPRVCRPRPGYHQGRRHGETPAPTGTHETQCQADRKAPGSGGTESSQAIPLPANLMAS